MKIISILSMFIFFFSFSPFLEAGTRGGAQTVITSGRVVDHSTILTQGPHQVCSAGSVLQHVEGKGSVCVAEMGAGNRRGYAAGKESEIKMDSAFSNDFHRSEGNVRTSGEKNFNQPSSFHSSNRKKEGTFHSNKVRSSFHPRVHHSTK